MAGEYLQKVKGKKAPHRNRDEKKDIKPTENIVSEKILNQKTKRMDKLSLRIPMNINLLRMTSKQTL